MVINGVSRMSYLDYGREDKMGKKRERHRQKISEQMKKYDEKYTMESQYERPVVFLQLKLFHT